MSSTQGYVYILVKETLKYLPILGQGMILSGFIFMSRKIKVDKPRLTYRLAKLSAEKVAPDGSVYRNPMWLFLFPEGTLLSDKGLKKGKKWANAIDQKDPRSVLCPRSKGMLQCLLELNESVHWVYDCTIVYEGIP